ncbi:hypothetical protein GYH30_000973 [Glycine max]|nr:hypothetical protein GYH30_000973 [Glycine max]
MSKKATTKEFLDALRERYHVFDNTESGCTMKQLTNIRYDIVGDVIIVKHALNSLPFYFTQVKTAYNTIGEKWTVNDFITKCVVEEEELKKEKSDIALLSLHGKPISGKGHWRNTKTASNASNRYQVQGNQIRFNTTV